MKIIISPAKTLNFDKIDFNTFTQPYFLDKTINIISELKKLSVQDIQKKLKINENLSILNQKRYQNFDTKNNSNSKQTIFSYDGHLFKNIDIDSLKIDDLEFLQEHLFILSTLYGVLKPFDMIMPYRLDFLTDIKVNEKTLYEYWKDDITSYLNDIDDDIIVNLASNEYFKVINTKKLNKKVINIIFKELNKGKYKTMSMSAKKMRGIFLNFIAKNRITTVSDLIDFNKEDYYFSKENSNESNLVFLKD
jgi:hypothetical protein